MRCRYRLITLGTIDMQLLKVAEEKRRLERIVTHHERKVGKEIRMDGSRRNCSDYPSRSM